MSTSKERYRIYRRGNGIYYLQDKKTGKQESLKTKDKVEAARLAGARNQAFEQPALNVSMAKAYLAGRSPKLATRTWRDAIEEIGKTYKGPTARRWARFGRSAPLQSLLSKTLIETEATDLLSVLHHPEAGTSTNVWLRRLHNYSVEIGWLLQAVMPRRLWPKIVHGDRYAITEREHAAIIASEGNTERRLYYEMLWLTGGAQTDVSQLSSHNIHADENILMFYRQRFRNRPGYGLSRIVIGPSLQALLDQLPQEGYFFPRIRREKAEHRSTEFARRCRIVGVKARCLHSYRYAWAERAANAAMPEREAMKFLGHKSKAIHRAYAAKADAPILPLEHYELEKQRQTERALALPPSPKTE